MTRGIVSGFAAVALMGAATTARADEPRLRTDVSRNAARDGRGETTELRNAFTPDRSVDRYTADRNTEDRTSDRFSLDRFEGDRVSHNRGTPERQTSRQTPTLRNEYTVRFGEERDHVALPGSDAAGDSLKAMPAPSSAQAKPAMLQERPAKLPIKSDITNRVETKDGEGDDSAEAVSPKGTSKTTHTKSAVPAALPMKIEVKMHMNDGSDDAL
jgi:hypothetical protein